MRHSLSRVKRTNTESVIAVSTSSLLSWALGNEESCSRLCEQVAHRVNVQPSGNAAVRLESPHTRVHTR